MTVTRRAVCLQLTDSVPFILWNYSDQKFCISPIFNVWRLHLFYIKHWKQLLAFEIVSICKRRKRVVVVYDYYDSYTKRFEHHCAFTSIIAKVFLPVLAIAIIAMTTTVQYIDLAILLCTTCTLWLHFGWFHTIFNRKAWPTSFEIKIITFNKRSELYNGLKMNLAPGPFDKLLKRIPCGRKE